MSSDNGPFHLTCTRLGALLDCAGELDLVQAPRLTAVLGRLERPPMPVDLLLADVSFVDSYGLEPMISSAMRRARSGGPSLRVVRQSRAVRRLLHLIGVDADNEPVDLTAWAAARLAGDAVTRAGRR